jgi:hypothetical protein
MRADSWKAVWSDRASSALTTQARGREKKKEIPVSRHGPVNVSDYIDTLAVRPPPSLEDQIGPRSSKSQLDHIYTPSCMEIKAIGGGGYC